MQSRCRYNWNEGLDLLLIFSRSARHRTHVDRTTDWGWHTLLLLLYWRWACRSLCCISLSNRISELVIQAHLVHATAKESNRVRRCPKTDDLQRAFGGMFRAPFHLFCGNVLFPLFLLAFHPAIFGAHTLIWCQHAAQETQKTNSFLFLCCCMLPSQCSPHSSVHPSIRFLLASQTHESSLGCDY